MTNGNQILVAGASGRLRPVIETLLERGHAVRVTARDPAASHARELSALGAEIVRADLDDPASLARAMQGVDAAFAAGSPHQAGPAGETRQGINVAEAAAQAGVEHLVFSSGAGADGPTGVPVFESKRAVEQRIRELGIPHTILAPVYFMENAFNPWNLPALAAGRFPLPLPPDRKLQQVAIADLAAVAAAVIEHGPDPQTQRIEVASDELSGEQAAQALSAVTQRDFTFEQMPLNGLAPGLRSLFAWLANVGHDVDIARLRQRFPHLEWHTFQDWAATRRELKELQ